MENPDAPIPQASQSVLSQLKARVKITRTAAEMWKDDLLELIVDANLPFNLVEKPAFRRLLLGAGDSVAAECLPKASRTVYRWIDARYTQRLEEIKAQLRFTRSKIHTSFDVWTSPATQAFLSVVIYYVDSSGKRHTRLLAMERIFGSHSGENQAAILLQVFHRFGICDSTRLGFFVADNASNCDTAIRAAFRSLYPSRTAAQRAALEEIYRCRCIGHILNLAAKAFLVGTDTSILDRYDPASPDVDLEVVQEWRKRGPVGKLHNIVYWIRRSPKRKDKFTGYAKGQYERLAGPLIDVEEGGLELQWPQSSSRQRNEMEFNAGDDFARFATARRN